VGWSEVASVDPTEARKATVRRFGRSDRRALRKVEVRPLTPPRTPRYYQEDPVAASRLRADLEAAVPAL